MTSSSLPIGQMLLHKGLITQEELDASLQAQEKEGGYLGTHLILHSSANRREIYAALADQWTGKPAIDLIAQKPYVQLFRNLDPQRCINEGWVPWRRKGDTLYIATCQAPSEEVAEYARKKYNVPKVEFRVTTPWDLLQTLNSAARDPLLYRASDVLAEESPEQSAKNSLTRWQYVIPVLLVVLCLVGLVFWTSGTIAVLLLTANIIFLISIIFKTVAAVRGPILLEHREQIQLDIMQERDRQGLEPLWHNRIPDAELPVYTILVPAYKESNIITKVLDNLGRLDYPKSKLDVLVLLEEDDVETLEATKKMRPPEYVRIVVVPEGQPQTKPRACNYGLMFARGELVVIYDAEDRPDPEQLRMAIAAFRQNEFERKFLDPSIKPLICVQAALNYFNADQNVLTRMFAIEYAHWFDAMLPGLDESGVPLPLGGTSNHFRTKELRKLGAWDPYNVTEDADLGLRAATEGWEVSVIRSTTWEEACSQTPAWVRQRTRWIKGYMVTSAVNTRNIAGFYRRTGFMGLLGLVGLIMGTPLAFMLYPLVMGFTIITYVGVQFIGLNLPQPLIIGGIINMIFGNLMMIISSGIAAWHRYNWRIAIFSVFNPVYWFLHSWASWRAAYQLFFDPHRWEKTPHGLLADYEENLDGIG